MTKTWNEHINEQRARLEQMALGDDQWDLSDSDREACRSGADAIRLVDEYMGTPDFCNMEDLHARMRELVCRGQKP